MNLLKRFAFGLLGLSALMAVATTAVAEQLADKTITIGVAMRTQTQPRWRFDVASMQARADELGVKLLIQWANDDPIKQASQVENLLSQNPDALIIVPVDSQAAGRIVRSAHEQNVPVIGYDIGVSTTKLDYFLMRNNDRVGELQSQGALKMSPKGTFATSQAANVAACDQLEQPSGAIDARVRAVTG